MMRKQSMCSWVHVCGRGEKCVPAYCIPARRCRLFVKIAGRADTEVLQVPSWPEETVSAVIHFTLAVNPYALNTFNVPGAKLQMLKPGLRFTDEETAYLRDKAVCTCSYMSTPHVNSKSGVRAQMAIDATLLSRNCTDLRKP